MFACSWKFPKPQLRITLLCLCCSLVFTHLLFPFSGTLVLFPFCLLPVEKSLGNISISFCLDSSQWFALCSYFFYHHTYPGAWRNLPCFPTLGVPAGGRPLVPGLLACNKTNAQGNLPHSSLWRWGHGHNSLWVSHRYTQLRSSQAFPHGPAGPTPSREDGESLHVLLLVLIL